MPDKYDDAVAYLTAHPDEIKMAWQEGCRDGHRASCLFKMAGTSCGFGCITMIRNSPKWYSAQTPELTKAIREDHRLPNVPQDITVSHLPVFAEWQRKIDAEIAKVTK